MKKLFLTLFVLGSALFAADGASLYKKCATCHGLKADKVYLNKVPALNTIDSAKLVSSIKAYQEGKINDGKGNFGQGAIMKIQTKNLSDEDIKAIADYIQTLK